MNKKRNNNKNKINKKSNSSRVPFDCSGKFRSIKKSNFLEFDYVAENNERFGTKKMKM